MSLRSVCVIVCFRISLPFKAWKYSIIYICFILFIYLSTNVYPHCQWTNFFDPTSLLQRLWPINILAYIHIDGYTRVLVEDPLACHAVNISTFFLTSGTLSWFRFQATLCSGKACPSVAHPGDESQLIWANNSIPLFQWLFLLIFYLFIYGCTGSSLLLPADFSCCKAHALGHTGFSSCRSLALEC